MKMTIDAAERFADELGATLFFKHRGQDKLADPRALMTGCGQGFCWLSWPDGSQSYFRSFASVFGWLAEKTNAAEKNEKRQKAWALGRSSRYALNLFASNRVLADPALARRASGSLRVAFEALQMPGSDFLALHNLLRLKAVGIGRERPISAAVEAAFARLESLSLAINEELELSREIGAKQPIRRGASGRLAQRL